MALVRVAQYGALPGPVTDYQAQNAHLQAFTNQLLTQQFILDSGTAQPVIKQGTYVSHGGSLYIADADTPITGSPADGSVYIRVSGTTSLTVEFVTDISGYAWNPVYTALTSGGYTLLPYLIVKAGTTWTRYNFNPNNQQFGSLASLAVTGNTTVGGTLGVTGAISGASLSTTGNIAVGGTVDGHDIDSELDTLNSRVNQGVKTTDSPTFVSINTGHGANELYPMDQDVKTTASPTFVGLTTSGNLNARNGIRARGTNSASYTGKDLWEAIEARVGDISGYAIDGIPLSGTCYLGDGTTQCILAYVWQSSTGTKPYYIRYQAIGSTSTTDSILVDHDNTSTVIVRHALLVLVGGHA